MWRASSCMTPSKIVDQRRREEAGVGRDPEEPEGEERVEALAVAHAQEAPLGIARPLGRVVGIRDVVVPEQALEQRRVALLLVRLHRDRLAQHRDRARRRPWRGRAPPPCARCSTASPQKGSAAQPLAAPPASSSGQRTRRARSAWMRRRRTRGRNAPCARRCRSSADLMTRRRRIPARVRRDKPLAEAPVGCKFDRSRPSPKGTSMHTSACPARARLRRWPSALRRRRRRARPARPVTPLDLATTGTIEVDVGFEGTVPPMRSCRMGELRRVRRAAPGPGPRRRRAGQGRQGRRTPSST